MLFSQPLFQCRDADYRYAKLLKLERVHALKGLTLPRANRSGEIALAGSRHLRSTRAAAPVLFAKAVVAVRKTKLFYVYT
jgi:hypothetical protein